MDININTYNHRKNVATMEDHIEYVDAIKGVCGAAIFSEIWALGTIIASLCMHMEKKEHQKKLEMVATWTVHSGLSIFSLNIAAAVLGHLSMVALIEKIDGMVDKKKSSKLKMDIDLAKYDQRKNVAAALVILACICANAYMVSYTVQMSGQIEYEDAIRGVAIAALCSEVWCLITVVTGLVLSTKKDSLKKCEMVAKWTTISCFNIFILNIALAALGHVSMVSLKEKLDGMVSS